MLHIQLRGKVGNPGTTVKSGGFGYRCKERVNTVPSGANTVNDTRALLNRVAEFRRRLDAMPRLGGAANQKSAPKDPEPIMHSATESRTQAILTESRQQLAHTDD